MTTEVSHPSVVVDHYTADDFQDAFRRDLASAEDDVVIFSPFVSPNRFSSYVPAFQALALRGVGLRIFVRPASGQPANLASSFLGVVARLQALGAQIAQRSGMHEKIAALDARVLWHGSLNILSHGKTSESMLRFEFPELAAEVLRDLDVAAGRGDWESAMPGFIAEPRTPYDAGPVPDCPECGGVMAYHDVARLWICGEGPDCGGVVPAPAPGDTARELRAAPASIRCPVCSGELVLRSGPMARVSCGQCDFALDPRLARGVLRVLRRRAMS